VLAHEAGGPGFRDVLRCPTFIATLNVARQGHSRIPRNFSGGHMTRFPLAIMAVLALCLASPLMAQTAKTAAKPSKAAAAASTEIINLNTATAAQIATLPGIGLKTADLIVQYRQKNGPFKKIEEVMNVRGVGEKSFLKLKSRLAVTAPKAGE
jgi:competence protein ComEA